MKKVGGILVALLFAFAFATKSVDAATHSLNFEEALKEEGIEYDLSSYKEDDKQAIIYLFRGKGCGYCRRFLTFLNSIVSDYGKYFKVVSYEVWNDSDNKNLMTQVAEFFDKSAKGVPFIVIGDKVFEGYASDYDEEIKKAIKDLYDSNNKYDVLAEIEKAKGKDVPTQTTGDSGVLWNLLFAVLATAGIIGYETYRFGKLEKMLSKERKTK